MTNGTDMTRSKSYQYGSNGLLSQKTLPGGVTNSYTYDACSNLTGVNYASGAVLWSLADYTGRRTVSHTTLDGSTYPFVKTTRLDQYDCLDSIRCHQDNCYYQEDRYVFSLQTGNLTSRTLTGGQAQTFSYDNLDRLTGVFVGNNNQLTVSYAANGNISSKTDMGLYSYNSNSKPHAVDYILPPDNRPESEQYIEYNDWGKATDVFYYVGNDFYHLEMDYGPDRQHVSDRLLRNDTILYYRFCWDEYERMYWNGNQHTYYWIEAPDGLAGMFGLEYGHYNDGAIPFVAMTDHLGSLTALYNQYGNQTLGLAYDAWGRRMFTMNSMTQIKRGFTGHGHIDELGLINMGGRVYDPLQGRFLSPDNYIQLPDNPQNYNRYSYCLNNPLKYTDPDGESVFAAIAMGLFACGMTNVFIQANNNKIDDFGDAMNALLGGLSAGISEASSWALGFAELSTGSPLGILYGHAVNFSKSVNLTATLISSFANLPNASKIVLGRYYTDENGNAWDQAKQGLSRYLWEGPQTWAGYNWSQIRNIASKVDKVDYLAGSTFCINENGSFGSVSLGNYISADIDGSYNGKITDYPVLMHEYGHTFDSREAGPAYLFTIGIPSVISASNSEEKVVNGIPTTTHKLFWTEQRASLNSYYYFNKHYGIKITDFKHYLPYHQLLNNKR